MGDGTDHQTSGKIADTRIFGAERSGASRIPGRGSLCLQLRLCVDLPNTLDLAPLFEGTVTKRQLDIFDLAAELDRRGGNDVRSVFGHQLLDNQR